MEFIINKKSKQNFANTYELVIEFMYGDADGYNDVKFQFNKEKLNDKNFKNTLEDFIKSIQSCINLDNHGRVGFDDINECADWYMNGHDRCHYQYTPPYNWAKYCEEALENNFYNFDTLTLEEKTFIYYLPTNEGWFYSYNNLIMYYYDENGNQFEVEIK